MAGPKTTYSFKILDAVVDGPNESELVFINGVVVAAFIVRVLDLLPGAIFLLLPRRAEPGFARVGVAQDKIDSITAVNSFELCIGAKVVKSTRDRDPQFLSICPGVIIRTSSVGAASTGYAINAPAGASKAGAGGSVAKGSVATMGASVDSSMGAAVGVAAVPQAASTSEASTSREIRYVSFFIQTP
jgi:hypothetical protein